LVLLGLLFARAAAIRADEPELSFLNALSQSTALSASTTPANGDQNPYGVTVVPFGFFPGNAAIHPGDILVSNFNNGQNLQGAGTTIVSIAPGGAQHLFFQAPASLAPVGLTTALVALHSGIVIVGNTPTTDGTPGTISAGSLIFLNASGQVLLNLKSPALQGPWDMTADERNPFEPLLYVSNVLNGTVVRIQAHVRFDLQGQHVSTEQPVVIGSGFSHRTDPAALVVGPTGLLLTPDGQSLYVADTGNNRIQRLDSVRDARGSLGAGRTALSGAPLKGPLALAWTPFGTIVASNGDAAGDPATLPNMVVEFEPNEHMVVATRTLDTSGTPGGIFGIAIDRFAGHTALIFVDDNTATVNVLDLAH
ncbi:MAG TPA: hypothetical protein VH916_07950, partial [Dehalococcoidia bacterium]